MASLRSLTYVLEHFMCLTVLPKLARELPDFGGFRAQIRGVFSKYSVTCCVIFFRFTHFPSSPRVSPAETPPIDFNVGQG